MINKALDLRAFFPEYIDIEDVRQMSDASLHIYIKTVNETARCPECGKESTRVHSQCLRKNVRDLPILGKGVLVTITARRFFCDHDECRTSAFTEAMPDFIDSRWKWTQRCEELIMAIAMNTSCESAARICTLINIPVSGDTVIRMLLRHVVNAEFTGDSIGVDDWAVRKGHHYGTLVCDMESHRPLALLPGRDGESLRKWLEHNKQIKTVSRDRCGAYANAIRGILPDAVQIADRFHLHHNLLEAVQSALKGLVPEKVWITEHEGDLEDTVVKKTLRNDGDCGKPEAKN